MAQAGRYLSPSVHKGEDKESIEGGGGTITRRGSRPMNRTTALIGLMACLMLVPF
jgi:hypothetical protein